MTSCQVRSAVEDLGRADRDYISWPVTGASAEATAAVELEGSGTWLALELADGYATGYFAGPSFPSPAPAHVVAVTSHCRIRITDANISVTFDGGFIRLVP